MSAKKSIGALIILIFLNAMPKQWKLSAADAPVIRPDGVVSAASYEPGLGAAQWVSVFGANLAGTTRSWRAADFAGDELPTQLDGVSVSLNGLPGYVSFVSPGQINFLTPDSDAEGVVEVRVRTPAGVSAAVAVTRRKLAPALFVLETANHRYAAGTYADGTLVGPPGGVGGSPARPAAAGESIVLYGTSFGPTTPAYSASRVVTAPISLAAPVTVRIGGLPATVVYAGLVMPGVFQFNVVVPDLNEGDHAVIIDAGGFHTQTDVHIPITNSASGAGIIADHRTTDITQIPGPWIERARQNLKFYYGHTSHGMQVTEGMKRLQAQYGSQYAIAQGEALPSLSGALNILEISTYDWDPDFHSTVPRILARYPEINLVMFMWCGQPGGVAWQTLLNKYVSDMQALERQYPKVTFIYATGQAQETDCAGCVRQQFNEQLRKFAKDNNKVLFDFGDLDAWYNGQMQTYAAPNWCGQYGCSAGLRIPSEHPQWGGGNYDNPCGHATYASCENKARAMWWLLARIAGWKGPQ